MFDLKKLLLLTTLSFCGVTILNASELSSNPLQSPHQGKKTVPFVISDEPTPEVATAATAASPLQEMPFYHEDTVEVEDYYQNLTVARIAGLIPHSGDYTFSEAKEAVNASLMRSSKFPDDDHSLSYIIREATKRLEWGSVDYNKITTDKIARLVALSTFAAYEHPQIKDAVVSVLWQCPKFPDTPHALDYVISETLKKLQRGLPSQPQLSN